MKKLLARASGCSAVGSKRLTPGIHMPQNHTSAASSGAARNHCSNSGDEPAQPGQ